MPDKLHVIWSLESSTQVQSIKTCLLDKWSQREVNNFIYKLQQFEYLVSHFPNLYPASLTHSELRKAVITKYQSIL